MPSTPTPPLLQTGGPGQEVLWKAEDERPEGQMGLKGSQIWASSPVWATPAVDSAFLCFPEECAENTLGEVEQGMVTG